MLAGALLRSDTVYASEAKMRRNRDRYSMIPLRSIVLVMIAAVSSGCASYTTPGGPVDLTGIQSPDIQELLAREPTAAFPALISFVRVQSPNYRSQSASTYGTGAYSVVITREFMLDDSIDRMTQWPKVRGVTPISRLLLPAQLTSLDDLRASSANLKSDILLVFTIDTAFRVDGQNIGPLTLVSLGILRDRETVVTTTASAIFVDVRSGFIYGTAEGTAIESKKTNAWGTTNAVDQGRLITEKSAFDQLMTELGITWQGIVAEHLASVR
jgi:hypothetical protein